MKNVSQKYREKIESSGYTIDVDYSNPFWNDYVIVTATPKYFMSEHEVKKRIGKLIAREYREKNNFLPIGKKLVVDIQHPEIHKILQKGKQKCEKNPEHISAGFFIEQDEYFYFDYNEDSWVMVKFEGAKAPEGMQSEFEGGLWW